MSYPEAHVPQASNGEWRTTKTHSQEQMAECYRQLFFAFGQPMLRKGTSSAASPSSTASSPPLVENLRTVSALDKLYDRHCAVVNAIAEDSVFGKKEETSDDLPSDIAAAAVAAVKGSKHIPMPSMLCGSLYDAGKTHNTTFPSALVAHLPFAFVESIFKSFGQLDYFHYEPERGVGTVIFRSGIDGEVCYVTKHLTSMVVPSIAHMRNGGNNVPIDIDDVFADGVDAKRLPNAQSPEALPQLVPVVMHLEFSSFLPFYNPSLVANAGEASGITRHLLRTFPVPYADEGAHAAAKQKKASASDAEAAKDDANNTGGDEDWQLKPFMKATSADGVPSLPFQRVWKGQIDVKQYQQQTQAEGETPSAVADKSAANTEGSDASSPQKSFLAKLTFTPIERLVIEELFAMSVSSSSSSPSSSSALPGSINYMDLWVAYVCRFVLWKPSFPKSLLETAGVFSKGDAGALDRSKDGGDEDDEDEAFYQNTIADSSKAILSLALRSTTSFTDVMALLGPVALHKYATSLEYYLTTDCTNHNGSPSPSTSCSGAAAVNAAKSLLAKSFVQYSAGTRRGLNLRRRLAYTDDGYSIGSGGVSSYAQEVSFSPSISSNAAAGADQRQQQQSQQKQHDNLILQRLRGFHFDELVAVHYPSLSAHKKKLLLKKAKQSKSSAATDVALPLGAGEEAFYALCRRLVEDETLHCSMANVQYNLRAQNDSSLAYWWLELKIRKLVSAHETLVAARKKEGEEGEEKGGDSAKQPSVWDLHASTADISTRMGLEDSRAVTFIAESSIVQLGLNVTDNAFLLKNIQAYPNGLPERLLVGGSANNATTEGGASPQHQQSSTTQQQQPLQHLPAAQFPDVLNLMDEHAMSGSPNSLYSILLPPAWFMDPRGGGLSAQTNSGGGAGAAAVTQQQIVGACGLGALVVAQQQRYSGPLGMLVMVLELLGGPLKVPLIATWLIGLVALLVMWAAGN